MKKPIVCCIAVLLLLTLTACSAPEIPMIAHETQAVEGAQTPSETAAPESSQAPEKQFSRGAWAGRTFTSDYAELTLTLPDENWVISTDEELAEIMNVSVDELGGNPLEKAMIQLPNSTDMMVQHPETGASIILMYENLGLNPAAKGLTVEDYAQIIADGLTGNESFSYTVDEPVAVTLCGNEYLALYAHVEGYDLHQAYLMRYEGDRMVNLILTGVGEDGIEALLAMFSD